MVMKLATTSCVMFWIGPSQPFKASTMPRFTSSRKPQHIGQLEEMHAELIADGYQAEVVDEQTAETVRKYWRGAV